MSIGTNMYVSNFKKSDLSEMNITTPGYINTPNADDIIDSQVKRGEAFTFHINNKKCAVMGFLTDVISNGVMIWMCVDPYIRECKRNKIQFLQICHGIDRYAKIRYKGMDFFGFTESDDKIYHDFMIRFNFEIISKYEMGYIYKRKI